MRMGRWAWAASALMLAACQTIYEELPNHTGNPTTSIVVTAPTVNPTPVPVVIPTAAPAPAPTAAPLIPPTAPPPATAPPSGGNPSATSCSLPRGTGSGVDCPRRSPSFLDDLESAIDAVQRSQPHLFDGGRVLDSSRYVPALMAELSRRGLCSLHDGDEIAIKNSNSFSDQYALISSSGYVRRGDNAYRATCFPAWF